MIHTPIVDTANVACQIEVTHHSHDAVKGYWNKAAICLDHIKLNVFVEGDFSLFINDKRYRPIYGDVCFLPPAQLHCGQVESQTHLDYFQLDIGLEAMDHIPGGADMLSQLIANSEKHHHYLRPNSEDKQRLVDLCCLLEAAVMAHEGPLAFAYTIQLLSFLNKLYASSKETPNVTLSKTTAAVLRYIKAHYQEKVTIVQLVELLGVSATYLSLCFKNEIGLSIHAYLTEYRITQAISLLPDHSIAETCYLCGFCDSSHFISAFKKRFHCTPAMYKKRHIP